MKIKSVRKFVTSLALGGTLIFGGTTSATEIDSDGMQIFTRTLNETATSDNGVFRDNIIVTTPGFMWNLAIDGFSENDELKCKGSFIVRMTEDDGSLDEQNVPFYVTQSGNNFTVYYQTAKKKWVKRTIPNSVAEFADVFAMTSAQDTRMILRLVRDVDVLQDDDARCTMRVRLDGNKIADLYREVTEQTPTIGDNLKSYMDVGLRNADVWYIWTVDKTAWRTLRISANLSDIVQSIAQVALNDASKDWGAFRETLEVAAFHGDVRINAGFLDRDVKKQLEIPAKVLKAKEAE